MKISSIFRPATARSIIGNSDVTDREKGFPEKIRIYERCQNENEADQRCQPPLEMEMGIEKVTEA